MRGSIMHIWTFTRKYCRKLNLISSCTVNEISCTKLIYFRVIGHSLGAALATHAAAQLIKAGHKVILFENYGSPRVGDKAFSNWFQQIYPNALKPRVTHARDPVPHLPPKEWGFEHIQTEIFYEGSLKKGYKICNDQNGEDKTCADKYLADVNVLDHLTYYDIDFTEAVLACQ